MTPTEVLEMLEENEIKMIDIRFVDFKGVWQHFSIPASEFSEDSFEDGYGFDGSSIDGWQPIHASDMLAIPDVNTAKIDPFYEEPTMVFIADIVDPVTREPYTRDPRNVVKKAVTYLRGAGLGDTCYIGPEAEFFIFDNVRYEAEMNRCSYEVDSINGVWNTNRNEGPNLGYKAGIKGGYFPVAPADKFHDLRTEMVMVMQELGIEVEASHCEVATGGQNEIDMRFKDILSMGDQMMWFKYIVKNVANSFGHTVTFMPKPIFGDNGSGMHIHISLWKDGKPLFAGDRYGGMSQEGLWGIGGIMKHCKALCAFTNPTTNSYKRLVPGYEAPINIAYSGRNRSAAIRLPMVSSSPKAKRIEFRTPDPSCNPYLAFAAVMMAVVDGIQNKIEPGEPMDKNIYNLPPEELAKIDSAPGSLEEALEALKADHDFLLKGEVFTKDLLENWIALKTEENNDVRRRPHPQEFLLYYAI